MSCEICIETFNKSTKKMISCHLSECKKEMCRDCAKKYILSKREDAHCMFCKGIWTREYLLYKFEKNFVNKIYKEYRENILFERETALLPLTQLHVEKKIQIKNLMQRYKQHNDTINELKIQKNEIDRELHRLRHETNEELDKERRVFIRQCPNNDCKGFLSQSLKCTLCNLWACGECLDVKGTEKTSEHTCNSDTLKTAKLLSKDSKSCPSCGIIIFKISGCNVMFCTQCHKGFDWKTLRIINGTVTHNPHYFEYMQQNRNVLDRPINNRTDREIICGEEIDLDFIIQFNRKIRYTPKRQIYTYRDINYGYQKQFKDFNSNQECFNELIRNLIHIRMIEMERFRVDIIKDNLNLRIKYMMNEITEDQLKVSLQQYEKKNQKKNEIFNILELYVNCTTDILHKYFAILNMVNSITELIKCKKEIDILKEYTNEQFKKISQLYNSTLYKINKYYIFE